MGSMTAEEERRWKNCCWVWCWTCGGGTIKKIGWGHKKTGHDVVSLKTAGKLEEAKAEWLFIARGGDVARRAVKESRKRAEAGVVSALVPAQQDCG